MSTAPFSTVLDFRLDVEGDPPRTVAHDYVPVPLSELGVGDEPEAALDALLPRLTETAGRPAAPGGSGRTAALLAAVVRAPAIDAGATSSTEVGAELTEWREVARLDWPHEPGGEEERRAAYDLIEGLDPRGA